MCAMQGNISSPELVSVLSHCSELRLVSEPSHYSELQLVAVPSHYSELQLVSVPSSSNELKHQLLRWTWDEWPCLLFFSASMMSLRLAALEHTSPRTHDTAVAGDLCGTYNDLSSANGRRVAAMIPS